MQLEIQALPSSLMPTARFAAAAVVALGREEALGQNPRFLKSGRQDRAFYTELWRQLLDKGHWVGELWNRRKNGEHYAELKTISAVRDEKGAVRQYVALFSDITEIKEHEQQLHGKCCGKAPIQRFVGVGGDIGAQHLVLRPADQRGGDVIAQRQDEGHQAARDRKSVV